MKASRKTAKQLGTSLLCLSLFASSGSLMVNGIFAAPPTSPKPGQTTRTVQPIPTTVTEDKGAQQTGGVGSFFKGVGTKMKGAFKPDSEKADQDRPSTSKAASPAPSVTTSKPAPQQPTAKQTVAPQSAPSQVSRNNPMRPNNVASVPAKPAEPGKLNSQMTGSQTNEVMKQLEELYKADGRVMPDMGALRDSHTETAQQIKKMDQKATVRPSELSDNPLTKARAYIPGMDKPIETPKLVDKDLPSILPETRVTASDVKNSLPAVPGPTFVPPAVPTMPPTPASTPKVVKSSPVMTPPDDDSMAWASSAPAATPKPAPASPTTSSAGLFPDVVSTTNPSESRSNPVVKPSVQHPLLDAAPAATANKTVSSTPPAGMFPDDVTSAPAKTPATKTNAATSQTPSLGQVGQFPGHEDAVAVSAGQTSPKTAPKMDEDHFFVIETENDVEDLDISKDIVAKPAAVIATPVSATPTPQQPMDSSTAPYRPETDVVKQEQKPSAVIAQPVKVEGTPSRSVNNDSPFVAANEAAANAKPDANNPFKFPEGGLIEADEALARAPKVESKPVEVKTADATPSFLPEAPKAKGVESKPAPIPMVLPPAPTFPNDEFSEEKSAPVTPPVVPAPSTKQEDQVAATTPEMQDVTTKKEMIDSDLVIEGDPAFSAMALAEAAANASREQDKEMPATAGTTTDAFIIPPLPGTADETEAVIAGDAVKQQPVMNFEKAPAENSASEKTQHNVVKKDDSSEIMVAPVEKPMVAESVSKKKTPLTPQQKYELIGSRKSVRGFKGFCPVALRDSRELLDTDPEFQVLYQEKLYYFSSNDAKRQFEGNPEYYLPASSGRDVVIFKDSRTVEEGMLDFAVWYQGRLYLFASKDSMAKFSAAPTDYAVGEALIETTSH